MTGESLFDRAADYETTETDIAEVLRARREDDG